MTVLIELLKLNVALFEFVSKGYPEEEQDQENFTVKLFAFLDKREKMLVDVSEPKTEEEQRIALTIIDYQKKIDQILNQNKLVLQKEIKSLKQKKVQNRGYESPFDNPYNDGIFFDKKK